VTDLVGKQSHVCMVTEGVMYASASPELEAGSASTERESATKRKSTTVVVEVCAASAAPLVEVLSAIVLAALLYRVNVRNQTSVSGCFSVR
jgi:hypothetical protein